MPDIIEIFIYSFLYFLQGANMVLVLHLMLNVKDQLKKYIFYIWLIYALFVPVVRIARIYGFTGGNVICNIWTFSFFIIPYFLYKDVWWKKFLAPLFINIVIILGDLISAGIASLLYPGNLEIMFLINNESIVMSIIAMTVLIVLYVPCLIVWDLFQNKTLIHDFFQIMLLPVCQLLFAMGEIRSFKILNTINPYFITAEIVGFLLDFLWIYKVFYLSKEAEASQLLEQMKNTMELEHQHYEEIERNRDLAAKIRHDVKNQITAAQKMLDSGHKEQAQQMMSELSDEINQTNEYPYSTIPIINAVLNQKNNECQEKGIHLEADIRLPETLPLNDVMLCSLFSNLLDNAIRSCCSFSEEERRIKISAIYEGGFLIIKMRNPSNGPEKLRQGHGTGTKILNYIAGKYRGEYKTSYADGEFTALITMHLLN